MPIAERIQSISPDGNTRVVECQVDNHIFQVTETLGSYTVYAKSILTGQGDFYRNADGLVVIVNAFSEEDVKEQAEKLLGPDWKVTVTDVSAGILEVA